MSAPNGFQLAFPEKHTDAVIKELAAQYTKATYVNALVEERSNDIEAFAQLLKLGHLNPNTHRVLLSQGRHCSLLLWACKVELDSRFEIAALLLACGANADAPEECMDNQTPREYVHECLRGLCTERMTEQYHYLLNLMREPLEDYPAKWGLKYAAGEGYFYGVQRLIEGSTVVECKAALKEAEAKVEEANRKWDTYSFILHDMYEDRTWFDELGERICILDRIIEHLDALLG